MAQSGDVMFHEPEWHCGGGPGCNWKDCEKAEPRAKNGALRYLVPTAELTSDLLIVSLAEVAMASNTIKGLKDRKQSVEQ